MKNLFAIILMVSALWVSTIAKAEMNYFLPNNVSYKSDIPMDKVPLVLTLGYGVHGNESSATNSFNFPIQGNLAGEG